jgi:ABC-type methionine transport system ATPase subunit
MVSEIMETLKAIRHELNLAIMLVDQSASTALSVADYCYVLENGRVVLDSDAERLRRHPQIQESCLGLSSGKRRTHTWPLKIEPHNLVGEKSAQGIKAEQVKKTPQSLASELFTGDHFL